MNQYTAVVKQEGSWWIGWIEEIPGVNCQEETREEPARRLGCCLRALRKSHREHLT